MARACSSLASVSVIVIVLASACAEDDTLPPAPVGGSRGSSPGVGGGVAGDDDGMASGGTGATTASDMASGEASSGTAGGQPLVAGTVLEGRGRWLLPMSCALRLHDASAVDPGSGFSSGFVVQVPITIDAFPHAYALEPVDVGNLVIAGDLVYVQIVCDADADGLVDPVGAWYPALPAELVPLPAAEIDLALGDLPI